MPPWKQLQRGKPWARMPGEARFPLSTTMERGDGRQSQISQQCGRSWQPPQFPAELPQINIRAEGTDLLLSKISKLYARVERKQEGSRGRRRRRRGMLTSRQIRWETSQPFTRNRHIIFYEVRNVLGGVGSPGTMGPGLSSWVTSLGW